MSQAPSPIDWERAEKVALSVAARRPTSTPATRSTAAADEGVASAAVIEDAIASVTGLRPANGTAQVEFVDRPTWIRANIESFQTLLGPIMERWQEKLPAPGSSTGSVTRQIAGAEVGALLGWMSTRVLGQYDILVGRGGRDDTVFLLAPNLAGIEHRYGFDQGEFRTWVLLHELTHRAQFNGVPWMRDHFSELVQQSMAFAEPDLNAFTDAVKSALRNRREASQHVRDSGVFGLMAPPEQRAVMAKIGGLMSLLEGHGDITMTRAAGPLVPNAERFERILRERRRNTNPLSRTIMRLAGIEAKLNQYAAGVRFIDAVEAVDGPRAIDRCWLHPDHVPSLEEIRAPRLWLDRMGATID
jgi:coenzyme F420 biosynthesis associated uncharacterized protein